MVSTTILADRLRGVGVTNPTPFSSDGTKVDLGGLRENIEHLVAGGVRLIYPCGNTGEFPSLSLDEWTAVVSTVIEVVAGRALVAPGVGGGMPQALEQRRRAHDLGADGMLCMPTTGPYLSQEGVVAYYRRLLEDSELPGVVYRRPPYMTDEALEQLLDLEAVTGVKYVGLDSHAFATLVREGPEDLVWTCGMAERYAPFLHVAGSAGFTSGLANIAPGLSLELGEALRDGDHDRAMELYWQLVPFEAIRARDGDANNVAAVKAGLDAVGLAGGPVRPPLRQLDAATREEVDDVVATWSVERG